MAFAIISLLIVFASCAVIGALADSKWIGKQLLKMKWWRELTK